MRITLNLDVSSITGFDIIPINHSIFIISIFQSEGCDF